MKNLIRRGSRSYSQQNFFATASVLLVRAMSLLVSPAAFDIFRSQDASRARARASQDRSVANIVRMYFVFRGLMKELDVNVVTSMQVLHSCCFNVRYKRNLSKSTYTLLARFRLASFLLAARAFAKSRSEIFMAMVFATTSGVIPRTIRGTSIQSRRGNLVSRGRNFSLPVSSGVPSLFELTSKRYRKRVAPFPKEFRRVVDVQKISVSW